MSSEDLAAALAQMGDEPIDLGEPAETAETVEESTAEEPKVDAPAEEPKAQEEPEEPAPPRLSKALARIARREAKALETESRLTQREAEMSARAEQLEAVSRRWAELQDMARKDPVQFLSEAGVDMDALSRALIHGEKPKQVAPEVSELKAEVLELKKLLQQRQQTDDQYQEQMRQQAVARHHATIEDFVRNSPIDIPYVSALDSKQAARAIFAEMQEHWVRTKTQLDIPDAARRLESQLRAHYETLSKAAQKTAAATPQSQGAGKPRTLTKQTGSRTAKAPGGGTDEENLRAALELFGEAPSKL